MTNGVILCDIPTRNTVHVTCMSHEIIMDLHELSNMHVATLMYMHVSCNMHGIGTFFMHAPCMLHDYNMNITFMLYTKNLAHVVCYFMLV